MSMVRHLGVSAWNLLFFSTWVLYFYHLSAKARADTEANAKPHLQVACGVAGSRTAHVLENATRLLREMPRKTCGFVTKCRTLDGCNISLKECIGRNRPAQNPTFVYTWRKKLLLSFVQVLLFVLSRAHLALLRLRKHPLLVTTVALAVTHRHPAEITLNLAVAIAARTSLLATRSLPPRHEAKIMSFKHARRVD